MFRGQVIDAWVKRQVANNPIEGISSPTTGPLRPDFVDEVSGKWFDITTDGQWQMHVNKYKPVFGEGIKLLTQ